MKKIILNFTLILNVQKHHKIGTIDMRNRMAQRKQNREQQESSNKSAQKKQEHWTNIKMKSEKEIEFNVKELKKFI